RRRRSTARDSHHSTGLTSSRMRLSGQRVIVIGSGPSGAMAAHTLVEHGLPVTLLESGTRVPPGFLVRAMGRNILRRRPVLQPNQRASPSEHGGAWFESLVPGGLSNYWVGAVPRFGPDDFREGERLHERYRWPLSYDELVPYYQRTERMLRVVADRQDVPNLPAPVVYRACSLPGGWRSVAHQAAAVGHGLAPMPLADGPPWMVARTGVGFNSFTHIVEPLLGYPNFELRLGAHVVQLEWRGQTREVSSVIYRDRATGREERLPVAAVVLAAGPLASTRLLLNSRSADFPEGLGNTEGLLGKYLHEHPSHWFRIELSERALPRLGQAAYLTRGPSQTSSPLLAAACTIGFASTTDKLWSALPVPATRFGVLVFGTMVPVESNFLRLHASDTDEFGLPTLDAHIAYTSDELQNLAGARQKLASILDSAGYACSVPRYVPDPQPGMSVHYGGTVRMHASPKYGMLNAWNRLHAVDNVVVADASAFTTGVEKNPTLTAMALAARAAERLAQDLKAG
ncbi:MAG TPA: GMC oxidoreductase, partial [Chloroflexota bacterium]